MADLTFQQVIPTEIEEEFFKTSTILFLLKILFFYLSLNKTMKFFCLQWNKSIKAIYQAKIGISFEIRTKLESYYEGKKRIGLNEIQFC